MTDDVKRLAAEVEDLLAKNPEYADILTEAVGKGLQHYKAAVDARRGWQTTRALSDVISQQKWKKRAPNGTQIPLLLGAAFMLFPNGVRGHSEVEREFWDYFLESARQWKVDLKWMGSVRGYEYVEWWNRVVGPELAKVSS